MNVLVTGGTGTLGSAFVDAAIEAGHSVRILSRRPRPENGTNDVEWAQADLATGDGMPEAISGADAILHAATSPGFRAAKVDVEGTRRLVEASHAAGVEHFIYPSIVGVDEIPFSYYRHKLEAERIVEESRVPHSILRATQFHAFVDQLISAAMRLPLLTLLPTDFLVQSVAASEVAGHLSRLLDGGASGRLPNFGGPEVHHLGDMASVWMEARRTQKQVVPLPLPGQMAQAFREGKNTDATRKEGSITWREWLNERERT